MSTPRSWGQKRFIVALLASPTEELFSAQVEVECYTPAAAKPGDMMDNRVEMWRATEKAMQGYKRYCHDNGVQIKPVVSIITTMLPDLVYS